MHILVLYATMRGEIRKTIVDSLYCFSRYTKGHRFYYLDVQSAEAMSDALARIPFDGVILHYTVCSLRNDRDKWTPVFPRLKAFLGGVQGVKVAIPQDEYTALGDIRALVRGGGISHIFTLVRPEFYEDFYPPEETGGAGCTTVHPGYVDERSLRQISRMAAKVQKRTIDVGYRARKLPYWVGRHGQLKTELSEKVGPVLAGCQGMVTDINTTGELGQNVFQGDSWIEFLLHCRTMLGCVGGGSLLDVTGDIRDAVNAYVAAKPDAPFEEVEAACFAGQDYRSTYFCLGPRHFECAMTKTCQVLVEGDYFGVFEPDVHYIELKKDYSNMDDVVARIADTAYCEQLAQRCYDDVVAQPGRENPNTYAFYANQVVDLMVEKSTGATRRGRWLLYGLQFLLYRRGYYIRMALGRAGKKMEVRRDRWRFRFFSFWERHPGPVRFYQRTVGRLFGKKGGRG